MLPRTVSARPPAVPNAERDPIFVGLVLLVSVLVGLLLAVDTGGSAGLVRGAASAVAAFAILIAIPIISRTTVRAARGRFWLAPPD